MCVDDAPVATCPICGHVYDERAYQVVIEGVGSFDSVACADAAVRRKARDQRAELVPALVDPEDEAEPIPTDRRN